jgi:hypothetical protein
MDIAVNGHLKNLEINNTLSHSQTNVFTCAGQFSPLPCHYRTSTSSLVVILFLSCRNTVHDDNFAKSSSFSTMPPLNRELTLIEVEDDQARHRSTSTQSGTTNDPCPSPTGSCLSFEELEVFKFASHSHNHQDGRKRVTFKTGNEFQQVRFIEPSIEWLHGEHSARWYSQDDYGNFRRDVFHTLYLLRNRPEGLDGVSYTARGTECRDPSVVERRQRVKLLSWQAVFDEQVARRKDASGKPSGQDDWMATRYSDLARPALREALDLAALDEQEAKKIHNELSEMEITQDDSFSDDWIRSISSHSTSDDSASDLSMHNEGFEDISGFCVFGAPSGFDDGWIRGN